MSDKNTKKNPACKSREQYITDMKSAARRHGITMEQYIVASSLRYHTSGLESSHHTRFHDAKEFGIANGDLITINKP